MESPDPALLRALRTALAERPEVLEAYLFGSQARGDARPGSDVDVAVYVEEAALQVPGFGYDSEIGATLQKALKRSDVDIVILNSAPPLLYYRVLHDGVRIVSRDLVATTTRAGRALSRYYDYVPVLAKLERAYARRRSPTGQSGP